MGALSGVRGSGRPPWNAVVAWASIAVLAAGRDVPAADVVVVSEDLAAPGDLAVTPNRQTVLCLDDSTGAVLAFDPREPTRRRTVLAATTEGQPTPIALGCLDTGTIVVLCRGGTGFSLRTWRLTPDRAADPSATLQDLSLGDMSADGAPPAVAVSHARDWLAIAGQPLTGGVIRCPIAGVRLGRPSDRGCPQVPAGDRPVAIAVTGGDQFVVAERQPGDAATDRLAWSDGITGRRLLALDTTLRGIRHLAIAPGDGTIWAATSAEDAPDRPAGLWRIDAATRHGRQVVIPVCVAVLPDIRGLVCPNDTAVFVSQGGTHGRIVRVDGSTPPASPRGTER